MALTQTGRQCDHSSNSESVLKEMARLQVLWEHQHYTRAFSLAHRTGPGGGPDRTSL